MLENFSQVADKYEGCIIDLWGVVHDGQKAFPNSQQAMARLRAMGKKVCLLSNAPSRASMVAAHLRQLGVHEYDFLMTSGELAWLGLKQATEQDMAGLRGNGLVLGYWQGFDLFDGIDNIKLCFKVEQADFACCVQVPEGDYMPLLRQMAEKNLPLICVNPDLVVLLNGRLAACPGSLALQYTQLGGRVIYRGKPYGHGYQACFEFCASSNLAAIGDGLLTDIKGANLAGLDSYFVANGIHGESLEFDSAGRPAEASLEKLFQYYGIRPTATMPEFRW